jgi:hypothetical protein
MPCHSPSLPHPLIAPRWHLPAALLLLLHLAACADDRGDKQGTPLGTAVARADAGGADAPLDAPADAAGNVGDARPEAGTADSAPAAPPGSTGGGVTCDSCERRECGDYPTKCLGALGRAMEGARKDVPRAELCLDLLTCVRRTACASHSARDCYCGAGVSEQDCAAGKASGPCKGQVEGGAESSDAKVVVARLFDPNFATGSALTLIEACDRSSCADDCKLASPLGPGGMRMCAAPVLAQCPDLDGNCVADCGETLVQNPGFVDVGGWSAEPSSKLGWDTSDAGGQASSGALAIWNTLVADANQASLVGGRQCLGKITPGARYELYANAFIAPGQSAGSAAIAGTFFASADCSGVALAVKAKGAAPMLEGRTDTWLTVSGGGEAPAGAGSLSVRLLVAKQVRSPPLRVLFDNVLVARRSP